MKKRIIATICMVIMILTACGSEEISYDNDLNTMEYIEGYEGMSDEEINQKLIEEARKMEVVPDKTE